MNQESHRVARLWALAPACILTLCLGPGTLTHNPADAATRLAGRITEYPLPTPDSYPHAPAVDPGGHVWYTAMNANLIGRFDPGSRTFMEFSLPTRDARPLGLTSDPDGIIWFTLNRAGRIGRLDPQTGLVREFVAPTARDPHTPVFGPQGRLWFTAPNSDRVAWLNPKTYSLKEYRVPTRPAQPSGIIAGPDGQLWFCEFAAGKLASIDPNTGNITEIPTPTPDSGPRRLAADGAHIWITLNRAGKLARFNLRTREWKEWPSPSGPGSEPYGIAIDRSGAVWYNEAAANRMVRFDPAMQTFETFSMPSPNSIVRHIARAPDGALWLAVSGPRGHGNNQLARID